MIDDHKIDDRLRELFAAAERHVVPADVSARIVEVLAHQRRQRRHLLLAATVLGAALALPSLWPAMMIVTERMAAIVHM